MPLSLEALDITGSTQTVTNPHTIDELTTVSLTGTGVFDILMRSVKLHLKDEYDNRRITGKEYSQVYIQSLTAVLQQSIAYILQQEQLAKIQAEIGLLRQKIVTELAQTDELIPEGLGFNDGTDVSGTTGKQKELLAAQTDGFERDAEQKLAKMLIETWSVRRTTDSGTTVNLNGMHDAAIKEIIDKAREGIGLTAASVIEEEPV